MRSRVDLDAQRHAAVHRHRQRLRAAHAAEAGGQRDRPGQRAAEAPPGDLGEALVGALHDPLACRCRSTTRRSSARTSSARAPRAGGTRPRSPTRARGSSWRSAPAAPTRACGTRRPACPTARAASRRPRASRSVRTIASNASHERAARPGAAVDDEVVGALGDLGVEVVHQHPQRGLLRPALAGELGAARRADLARARSSQRPDRGLDRLDAARRSATSSSAAASSGASQRSGPGPGDARAHGVAAPRPCPRAGLAAARAGRAPRAAHDELDGEDPREVRRATVRSLRAAPQPIDTWSSCIALVGSESTLAGAARRRFSATIAACVYWAIISPEFDARRPAARNGGRPVRAASRRAAGRCGARRSRRPRRPRSRGSRRRTPSGAPWKLPHDSTRPSGSTIGLSIAERELGRRHPLGVRERVARGAVHLRRAAQRVGVLHARVAVAVAGDDRRAGEQRGAGSRRSPPGRAAGAARCRSAANARSVPSSASTDIAAVMSATPQQRVEVVRARAPACRGCRRCR